MNLDRLQLLREPSTWAGLGMLAMLAGATIEDAQAIGNAGAAVGGALAVLLRERK
jgi:hypothetical protein